MARSLPDNFPGLAALQDAGEATPTKVRKRIADDTLTEIPGIGPATAEQIKTAFETFDTPEVQADELKEDDGSKPSDTLEEGKARAARDEAGTAPATHLNTGSHAADVASRSEGEKAKTSRDVANEQPNHALDRPAGASTTSGTMSDGERLAHSGAVYIDHPEGAYASRTAVRFGPGEGRVPQLAISSISPRTGMQIKDGDDMYALAEGFGRDTKPIDWLRVRSPNTGKPFIREEEVAAQA